MKTRAALGAAAGLMEARAGFKVPLRVSYCITYRCNLDCAYCRRHGMGGGELSSAQAKGLIDGFARAGARMWSFNGGEALMRKDIGELVGHAKRRGLHVSLATNGTLVAERIGEIALADMVTVSVDGPKDVHDLVRCGSYDRMVAGLNALRNAGIRTTFMTVVGSHNIGCLGDVLKLAREYGARSYFQPVRVQKEDLEGASMKYFPDKAAMAGAMEYLLAKKREGWPVASSAGYLRAIGKSWPGMMPDAACWAGRVFCFVDPQGYATHCCDTLAGAAGAPDCLAVGDPGRAFANLQARRCGTCHSSIPLETNLLMDSLPSGLARAGWDWISGRMG
jgi:MoaA/NifB/PqqE/SkfB family radical SAM enzyme